MARLSTSPAGATLLPPEPPPQLSPIRKKRRAPVKAYSTEVDEPAPTHCRECNGQLTDPVQRPKRKGSGKRWFHRCTHCSGMFGNGFLCGQTSSSPDEAVNRLKAVQAQGFIIILRSLSLGARDGSVLLIEPGDIFPIRYTQPAFGDESASVERTRSMFTLPLQVGPHQTHFFPHEFDAIRFDRVMGMKAANEIQETFVSLDDNVGHFTPRPDLLELIKSTFGSLVQ